MTDVRYESFNEVLRILRDYKTNGEEDIRFVPGKDYVLPSEQVTIETSYSHGGPEETTTGP